METKEWKQKYKSGKKVAHLITDLLLQIVTAGSTLGCHGLFLPPALGKAYEHYVGKALHSAAYL